MTDKVRKWRTVGMAAVSIIVLALGGVVLAKMITPEAEAREIRLVVRDMTYYAAGGPEANPTLKLTRGERVRFILVNEDPGYSHNLVAPVLGISTPVIKLGGTQSVEITVPAVTGVYPYACRPHAEMMRGNIAIE